MFMTGLLIRYTYLGALALFAGASTVSAQSFVTDKGKVEFISKASLETFTGTSSSLKGLVDLDNRKIDFYIDLNTLRTGISLRDEHMRETYLETKKYPFAEFTGTLSGFNPARKDTQTVVVVGDFTIHGVKKARTIPGRLFVGPNHVYVEAAWSVKLSDHNIEIPKVLFLKLADQQEVRIQAQLRRKE
jgi:polyisoprenoid-binding protein YceI